MTTDNHIEIDLNTFNKDELINILLYINKYNITLNEFVNKALTDIINKYENKDITDILANIKTKEINNI